MDKTVFFSASGSWDNMVNLRTKSFPGGHILVGARKVRVHASKNASPTGFVSKAVPAGAYRFVPNRRFGHLSLDGIYYIYLIYEIPNPIQYDQLNDTLFLKPFSLCF